MAKLDRLFVLKWTPAAAAAACLCLNGCMGYTLTPEKPASMPRAEASPLALTAGVIVEGDAFSAKLAEALDGARLFKEVRKGAATGVDVVLRGRFKAEFVQDPLQTPKIFLVCFTGFVTGALMSETSHHLAEGALMIAYPNGDAVKSYDERVDVVAKSMVSMFAEQKTMKLGPPAALDNLVAKLVQGLIDDRAFLETLTPAGRRAAPPPAPEPVAAVETAPVETAAAEPAPAEPAAAVEPAKPEPLTPAQESEIDEQLMP